MALIPDDVISEIRDRVDLVAVIGEHVHLKKAGTSWKGLCPFHAEKTPSFHVTPSKHSFYCFGCQEKGDVYSFLMKMQGKTFGEVVRELAGRTGVTIPERPESADDRARRTEKERLHEVNAITAAFFREQLADPQVGEPARRYLESRGIGAAVSETFQLGLAPDAWDTLGVRLEARNVPVQLPVMLGLIAARTNSKGYYDKFRNRVMCPVIQPGGEIAGFSGRTLGTDPETPKYVNSPESPVYKKSHLLFGLHAARPAFRTKNRALLVEGNFDVVALHQAGFNEAVAPLGTALTEHQVAILRRLAPTIVVCFDGDRAGRAASLKAVELLVATGVEARVASLPDGEDPDSFVRKHGAAALEELLARAKPCIEYFLDERWYRSDQSVDARTTVLREGAPLIASVRDMPEKRLIMIGVFAKALGVEQSVVERTVATHLHNSANGAARAAAPATQKPSGPPPPLELEIFCILADHPDLRSVAEAKGVATLLTDGRLRDMYLAVLSGQNMLDVASSSYGELSDALAKKLLAGDYLSLPEPRRTLLEAIRTLENDRLLVDAEELRRQLKDAERRGDSARVRELAMLQLTTKQKAKA